MYDHFPCQCLSRFDGTYQLGICKSVLQYLCDDDVDFVLRALSKQCDFLYFDVVCKEEYDAMEKGSTFSDQWAIRTRSVEWYRSRIFRYWRIIGNELLESKHFYPENADSSVPCQVFMFQGKKGEDTM